MGRLRLLFVALGLLGVFIFAAAPEVFAEDPLAEACDAAPESAACSGGDAALTGSDGLIARVTNLVAVVGGVLAVIVMVWGGFKYVTSGGDSGKTNEARSTIIYAAIGLVIIVLAQSLVAFVLSRLN